jgi:uncharacterized protein (UPF0262 family)
VSGTAVADRRRLIAVTLDDGSIARGNADQDHERLTAIHDLIEDNVFAPVAHDGGPYCLHLAIQDAKLAFDVRDEAGRTIVTHLLSLTPFRRILKDYFLVCENYYAAIRTAMPSRIEAIDMGRRGLHDEAGRLLAERLKDKIEMDFDTARRLFTLVMALHWKG